MHLSADELIELAERGRADDARSPHLAACEVCRHLLVDLRGVIAALDTVEVPEPSPLFWEHFSARVHEAVGAEGAPRRRSAAAEWVNGFARWPIASASAAVLAALLVAIALTRSAAPPRVSPPPAAPDAASLAAFGDADDPSLALVAGLVAGMDADLAVDTGLSNHVGSVDEVVTGLSRGERDELEKLLNQELAKS
jgi:hypothetical protein